MKQSWLKHRLLKLALGAILLWIPSKVFAISSTTVPSGNYSSTGTWTAVGVVSANIWDAVNDPIATPDDDTTYSTPSVAGTVMFNFPAFNIPVNSNIVSVQVFFRTKDATAGANSLAGALRVNNTTYTATSIDPGSVYETWIATWTTNPNTAAAWTVADINGTSGTPLQKFGFSSSDIAPLMRITQIYIQVNYDNPNRFWVGASQSNWNNVNNWSAGSGGPAGASVPASTHTATFDGSGLGTCLVDTAVSVSTLTVASGYTGTFNTQSYGITVSSAIIQSAGTITLGTSAITLSGNLSITAGTFNAGASTITLSGAKAQTLLTTGRQPANILVNKTATTIASLADGLSTIGRLTVTQGSFTTTSSNYFLGIGSDVVVNNGVFVLNNSSAEVSAGWNITSGVFVAAGSTVTFDSSASETITSTQSFANVRFNNANGTWTLGNKFNLTNLTLDNGTLNTSGSNYNITVANDLVGNAGTLSLNASSVTLQGNMRMIGADFIPGTSTMTFTGTATQTLITSGSNPGNIVISKTGPQFVNLGDQLTTIGMFTVTAGSFSTTASNYGIDVGSSVLLNGGTLVLNSSTMNVEGAWARTSGTFTPNSSTVTFNGSGTWTINAGTVPFNNVRFNNASGTWVLTGPFFPNSLSLDNGTLNTGSNFNMTTTNDLFGNGGVLTLNNSTVNVKGNWDWNSGTFNAGGSTVAFNATTTKSISSNGSSFANILINGSGGQWNLADPLFASGNLTVTLGTVTTTGGNFGIDVGTDVVVNGGVLTLNASTMTVGGGWTRSSGVFYSNTSTVTFDGSGSRNINIGTQQFNHVAFDNSNATWTLTAAMYTNGSMTLMDGVLNSGTNRNITVGGSVLLNGGIFNLNSSSMSVADDWNNAGTTFVAGGSTVSAVNAALPTQILGSTTFYSLTASVPGGTLTFQENSTTGVTGRLTLAGSSGSPLSVRSRTPGTQWYLRNTGTNAVSFTDAQDSNALGGNLITDTNGGIDSGNNQNWGFSDYVRYWVASSPGNWNTPANWSLASGGQGGFTMPASSQTAVFDGTSNKNGNALVNVAVSLSTLTITSNYTGTFNSQSYGLTISTAINQDGGTINLGTSAVTLQGDLNLTGGTFITSASTITLSLGKTQTLLTNGRELANLVVNKTASTIARPADQLTMHGFLTVTLGSFTTTTADYGIDVGSSVFINGGTLVLENSTMSVEGGWTRASGTFTPANSTVTFNGAGSWIINAGTVPFNNVRFNNSGGTWVMTGPLFPNDLSLDAGTLNTGSNFNLTVADDLVANGGNLTLNNSTANVRGNWTWNSGTFNAGFSTVSFNSTTNESVKMSNTAFAHVIFNGSGGQWTLNDGLNAAGNLTVTLGTVTTSGSNFGIDVGTDVVVNGGVLTLNASTMTVGGGWTRSSGVFNSNTSTVTFDGTGSRSINIGTQQFNHVVFNNLNATWTLTAAMYTNGSMTLLNGVLNSGTNRNITVGGSAILNGGIFNLNSSSMSVADDWNNSGVTFVAGGSTVSAVNAALPTQILGSTTFYSLTASVPGGTLTFQENSTTGVTGLLTLAGSSGSPLSVRSRTPGTQWYLRNTGTNAVSFTDAQDSNALGGNLITDTNGGVDSGNNDNWGFSDYVRYWVSSAQSTWNTPANWSMASGGTGGFTVPNSSQTAIIDGANNKNGNVLVNTTVSISTLTVSSGYNGTFNTQSYGLTISTALNQSGGTISLGTSAITLQGDLNLTGGTFQAGNSTFTISGTKNQDLQSSGRTLTNLVLNKSGGTASLDDGLDLDGNFTLTSGTLTTTSNNYGVSIGTNVVLTAGALYLNGSTVTVGGNWANNGGLFVYGTSTVTFTPSGISTLSGSTTFYALRSLLVGTTLQFTPNTTTYVSNTLDFRNLSLKSTTNGSTWYFMVSAPNRTLQSIFGRDSNASGGVLLQATSNSVNYGNNTNWDFGPPNAITNLTAAQSVLGASVYLTWSAPGDDAATGNLVNSTFTVQYTTSSAFAQTSSWNPTSGGLPAFVFTLNFPTTTVSPGASQAVTISTLTSAATYYFRAWTKDELGNYSTLSNGATNWATITISSISLSTDTLTLGPYVAGSTNVYTSSITVTNAGNWLSTFQLSVTEPAVWRSTTNAAGQDSFRLTAIFKDTIPLSSDFNIANDVVNFSTATASSTNYAKDADGIGIKGTAVAPGSTRGLWFRIEMPPVSTTSNAQTIRLNATSQ